MSDEPEQREKKWKRFEKLAYEIQKGLAGTAKVILNDSIMGVDSKTPRQIDISIRDNVAQYSVLVVIDCKDYKQPVDVKTVEGFVGLLRDVRANRGAVIAYNGFTEAAVNVAKSHGVDTFLLLDTESIDWQCYVTIPALLERTHFQKFSIMVEGTGLTRIPASAEGLGDLELYGEDGASLGTVKNILHSKWNKQEIPHEPGTHEVIIGKLVKVLFQGCESRLDVSATVLATREYYCGPIPVHLQGFQDVQKGGVITKKLRTEFIEPRKIESGEVPGWIKIDDPSNLPFEVFFHLGYSDMYDDGTDPNADDTTAQ
jgi:Restriction endonuclease